MDRENRERANVFLLEEESREKREKAEKEAEERRINAEKEAEEMKKWEKRVNKK